MAGAGACTYASTEGRGGGASGTVEEEDDP
jgi:hypothetical protein